MLGLLCRAMLCCVLGFAVSVDVSYCDTIRDHGWPYFSMLHPGHSDLNSACFLMQGDPNGVMGSRFVYDDREAKSCEVALWAEIRRIPPGDPPPGLPALGRESWTMFEVGSQRGIVESKPTIAGALLYLARGVYCSRYEPGKQTVTYLHLGEREREKYRKALVAECKRVKAHSVRKMIALATLYYYLYGVSAGEAAAYLRKVRGCGAPGARLVAANIAAVAKQLVVWRGEPRPHWERPEICR